MGAVKIAPKEHKAHATCKERHSWDVMWKTIKEWPKTRTMSVNPERCPICGLRWASVMSLEKDK